MFTMFDDEKSYQTLFRKACKSENVAFVDMCIQILGIVPSDYNNYAIRLASKNNCVSVVDKLLTYKVDPTTKNFDAFNSAIRRDYPNIVKRLVRYVDLNKLHRDFSSELLIYASTKGYIEILDEILLQDCIAVSWHFEDAINIASKNGHISIIDRLLQSGIRHFNPRRLNAQAILAAIRNGLNLVLQQI